MAGYPRRAASDAARPAPGLSLKRGHDAEPIA
jgi:hypothetical protein